MGQEPTHTIRPASCRCLPIAVSFNRLCLGGLLPSRARFRFAGYAHGIRSILCRQAHASCFYACRKNSHTERSPLDSAHVSCRLDQSPPFELWPEMGFRLRPKPVPPNGPSSATVPSSEQIENHQVQLFADKQAGHFISSGSRDRPDVVLPEVVVVFDNGASRLTALGTNPWPDPLNALNPFLPNPLASPPDGSPPRFRITCSFSER
jgi:hypothetical protein